MISDPAPTCTRWMALRTATAVCCLVATLAAAAEQSPTTERYVRYGFTVQNATGEMIPEAELWICAPLNKTSTQHLLSLKASQPYEQRTDDLGNHLLQFVISNVPPYAVRIVTVEVTLSMNAEPAPIKEEIEQWLKAGPFFEYDDMTFRQQAPKFPAGKSGATARLIFDWVRGHLQDVGYDGTDRGALYALTQQKGDCTEYAMLFVALCRKARIPTRALGGYVIDHNSVLDSASFHNWAEFYECGRWHVVDPQTGVFDEKADKYVAMRVLGGSESPLGSYPRYRCIGEGITVEMTQ